MMIAPRDEAGRRGQAALGMAGWLRLAAAPTFAVMALLNVVSGSGADMVCSAAHGVSLVSGMAPMYVLMTLFHSAPWLKLLCGRSSVAVGRPPALTAFCRVSRTARAGVARDAQEIYSAKIRS